MTAARPVGRILVIGLDGGTLDLVEPWAREGKLPALRRFFDEGVVGELASTIHPLTPQAWSSFLTGLNPGKHGVFDFGERVPGAYRLTLATAESRHGRALWDYLGDAGLTTGVVNIPLTYPPPAALHGYMVPGMHTPDARKGFVPASLYQEVAHCFPEYRIDALSNWFEGYDPFLEELHTMHRWRHELLLHLARTHPVDLMIAVLVSTDRISHALWQQADLPGTEGTRKGWRYAGEVLKVYQACDRTIGQLLDEMGSETVAMIVSDHGFGPLEKDVYLNRFLAEHGYLKLAPRASRGGWLSRLLGAPSEKATSRELGFDDVDWSRTRAYSHGLFGNVYVNLMGREPAGTIEPGAEYEALLDRLTDDFQQWIDPEDGALVVDRIDRRDDLYWGGHIGRAPDLLVRMRNYAYMTRGGAEFSWKGDEMLVRPRINHSGNHRVEGLFMALGGPFRRGSRIEGANLMDPAPTLLHLLGQPVSKDIDGRVLADALDPGFLDEHPVKYVDAETGADADAPPRVTAGDLAAIKKSLHGIGYFR